MTARAFRRPTPDDARRAADRDWRSTPATPTDERCKAWGQDRREAYFRAVFGIDRERER